LPAQAAEEEARLQTVVMPRDQASRNQDRERVRRVVFLRFQHRIDTRPPPEKFPVDTLRKAAFPIYRKKKIFGPLFIAARRYF